MNVDNASRPDVAVGGVSRVADLAAGPTSASSELGVGHEPNSSVVMDEISDERVLPPDRYLNPMDLDVADAANQ